ncbi:MAG: GH25 family lysozyme [Rhizomicrobium sp.]|jgi:lysozyme
MTTGTFGIDVSHFNGVVDWDAAIGVSSPQKINFCFAKASQLYFNSAGVLIKQHDVQFDRNWSELKRLNVPRGAYHYCMPEFTAQDMANWFFSVYTPSKGDLIPSLDIEDEYVKAISNGTKTQAELVNQIVAFGALVEAKIGRKPFIYTRKDITEALGSPAAFSAYPFWIANYNNPPSPPLPKPWTNYDFWQYSESGRWSGFGTTDVDFDYLNGDPTKLAAYTI